MKLNFIDLFCGAGGLSYGLQKSGMNCLAGIDFLPSAIETFNRNHKEGVGICCDIRNIKTSEINRIIKRRRVHLICGGPPCQGFSTIGTNDARDSRNHLFMQYIKFVETFKPNYIVLENVTGLLSKKNTNTLASIFKEFEDRGYHMDAAVLSAHHYGVPQHRRRVVLIGNNLEIENQFPRKQFNNYDENIKGYKKVKTVGWAFEKKLSYRNKSYNHDIDIAEIKKDIEKERIKHIPPGRSVRYERDEELLPKELRFDVDWNNIREKRFREAKLFRLDPNRPSPTIVTDGRRYYHPSEDRYLTVREAASLQSFPPNFKFAGAQTKMWVQIGNAVPPRLAESIGESIISMHKNKKKKVVHNKNRDIEILRSIAFKYDLDSHDNPELNQQSMNFG